MTLVQQQPAQVQAPAGGMFQWLDRAPYGRNETEQWWRRHDEYANG